MYYELKLFTQTIDTEGKATSESESFQFKNIEILVARREAITKSKALENKYNSNPSFISPQQAALKNYRDFSSYSITLSFIDDNGKNVVIYGEDEEEIIEGLSHEFNTFMTKGVVIKESEIEGVDYTYEVIEEELNYLLPEAKIC